MFRIFVIIFYSAYYATTTVCGTCANHPVNCQVAYSEWSSCDPCTQTRSRAINVTRPSQSGGFPCPNNVTQVQPCHDQLQNCVNPECMSKHDFLCGTGRCILPSLVCNGEDDCGDNSDERNCSTTVFSKSIQHCMELPAVPYKNHISSGYDPLTDEIKDRVFDNDRFDGYCREVQDGDSGMTYRLPFNVGTFQFSVKADGRSHSQVYDSFANYTTSNEDSSYSSSSSSDSYKVWFFASGSSSKSNSQSSTTKSLHNLCQKSRSKLYEIGTDVELAQFSLKAQPVILDPFFAQSIYRLPVKFNAKVYFEFIERYGTHYITAGSLGGAFTYYYVFQYSSTSNLWSNEQATSNAFSSDYNNKLFGQSWGGSTHYGGSTDSKQQTEQSMSNETFDTIVSVKGGTSNTAGVVTLNTSESGQSNYASWVESLKLNPTIIKKKLNSICDLIAFSGISDAEARSKNCITMVDLYYQHYSVVNCSDCRNGGKSINVGKTCYCACAAGFTGPDCAVKLSNSTSGTTRPNMLSQLKFITVIGADNVTAETHDPVLLVQKTVDAFAAIIKTKGNLQYYMTADGGQRYHSVGNFYLHIVDDLLMNEQVIKLNLNGINCDTVVCEIVDFDVDNNGNLVLSIKQSNFNSDPPTIAGSIYQMLKNGKIGYNINDPCIVPGKVLPSAYVTLTCEDKLIVGCYSNPATVKLYSSAGVPDQVIQFGDLNAINSMTMSEIDGTLWLHTIVGQVVSYDIKSWTRIHHIYTLAPSSSDYCQLSVDFMGNVIVAQDAKGSDAAKFTIFNPTTSSIIVEVFLSTKDNCRWASSYKGRVYLLCDEKTSTNVRSINVFDYIK